MNLHCATLLALFVASLAVTVGCETTTIRPGGGDGDGGGHASGGAGGAATSTWTSTQTSTGGACDHGGCNACQQCLVGSGAACESMYYACMSTNTMCDALNDCLNAGCVMTCDGVGTGGGTPTSTTSVSVCDYSGDCSTCMACAEQNDCASEAAACSADDECAGLRACVNICGNDPCVDECFATFPSGTDQYLAFLNCTICSACVSDCDAATMCD